MTTNLINWTFVIVNVAITFGKTSNHNQFIVKISQLNISNTPKNCLTHGMYKYIAAKYR